MLNGVILAAIAEAGRPRTSATWVHRVFRRAFASSVMSRPRLAVRSVSGDDRVSLSFSYTNQDLRINDRRFNFERHRGEQLSSVVTRIAANIERQAEKKLKKKRKKQQSEEAAPAAAPSVVLRRSVDGSAVADDTPCAEAFVDGVQLHVGDTVYEVVVNPPTIKSLSLPTTLMVGFPVHAKLELEFASLEDCVFAWYRGSSGGNENDWEHVGGTGYEYVPVAEDLTRPLRVVCLPKRPDVVGMEAETVSTVVVGAGPGACPFDNRHAFTATETDAERFRFVSYNILADLYADSDFSRTVLYPYCPPYALDISYRKQLLLKEITGYRGDIVCLQEVDSKIFDKDLSPSLRTRGMRGLFHPKGGLVAEGLACFYHENRFRLRHSQSIILAEEVQTNPLFIEFMDALGKNEKLKETFLQRTTALQIVVLECIDDSTRVLCIGNTHLYFRPDRDNIRLLQFGMCVTYLEQVAAIEASARPDAEVATVICGDFNSTPHFGVYQLATTQFIPDDHADWSSNAEEVVKDFSLSHTLQLSSACGTPTYTNFTAEFADCLDYIFIDKAKLRVHQVVPFPSEEELRQHTALPSVTMPSDHIALVADIKWSKL